MFGYVVANRVGLNQAQLERYQAAYCGLCRTIGQRHGQAARLCLTYDMTFLVLLLDSLGEPEQHIGNNACLMHPFQKREWHQSRWTEYSADMNVALAYYNCLDDWQDDHNPAKYAAAKALYPALKRVKKTFPQQCQLIEECLAQLSQFEREKSADLDGAAGCFGRLMAGLFAVGDAFWKPTLAAIGDQLGRFIYVMDAVLDEKEDEKKGRYNPVAAFRQKNGGFEAQTVLEMLIGECTMAFEQLPLEQDLDLLRNILYSGVWSQWVKARRKEETT